MLQIWFGPGSFFVCLLRIITKSQELSSVSLSTRAKCSVVPISLYNRYLRFFYYHIIVSLVKIAIFQNDNLIAIKNKDFLLMKIIVISDYFSTK